VYQFRVDSARQPFVNPDELRSRQASSKPKGALAMKRFLPWIVLAALALGGLSLADGTGESDPDLGFSMPAIHQLLT
jgi:hypothetical protein